MIKTRQHMRTQMNRRWAALGLMIAMMVQAPPAASSSQWDETEAQRLEKFALSQCLLHAFPDSPIAADAHRASGAYVELGNSPVDIYGEIDSLVQAHRAKPYHSKSGKSLFVMQCLDLLHDPALEALIRPGH